MSAPGPVLDEWFESRELRTALACFAIGGVVPLDEPMAGLIMSVMALQHQWGVRRPVGGMGQFTQALAQDVIARGGEIRTGSPVTALLAAQDQVVGVATRGGEEIRARSVIGAIDPTTLFLRLAPSDLVPAQVRTELGALGVYRNNFASFRTDVALRETPRLIVSAERSRELLPSSMMFATSIEAIRRTSNAIFGGEIAMPLVPPGSPGEGLYGFVPAVPFRLRDGKPWSEVRDAVLNDTLATFERFAPGASASIIGCAARTPEDLRSYSNVYQGNLFNADMSAAQMGPWRPTPSLSGYRSPIRGLWHTAAGAHPMGTICAWPGRAAAQTLLKDKHL
jgi:beta-carotene ketolase (CrtO type)